MVRPATNFRFYSSMKSNFMIYYLFSIIFEYEPTVLQYSINFALEVIWGERPTPPHPLASLSVWHFLKS